MICIEARSIQKIDEERWDSVTGGVLSMSHRWLRVVETHWRSHGSRYLLMEDQQGPCVAIAAKTAVDSDGMGLLGWLYHRLSLAVSLPFSSMCGVMVRPRIFGNSHATVGAGLGPIVPPRETPVPQH
jgi:hypothetical protein